ncbi:hypothetical protein ACF0H5_018066 [Mactra antiquata]
MFYKSLIIISVLVVGIECKDYDTQAYVPREYKADSMNISLRRYKDLVEDLLRGYDNRFRPRQLQIDPVEVLTRFNLETIINFDTTGQSLEVMGYFTVSWLDEILTWDPNDHSQCNNIRIPISDIWYPKFVISKGFDGKSTIGDVKSEIVKVTSNGTVNWVPYGSYRFLCEVNVEKYPFDHQICQLTYYIGGETMSTVILSVQPNVNVRDFAENSEWKLNSIKSSDLTKYSAKFVVIEFEIERRSQFTVFTMILPLTTVSVINVFTFLVPIQSGEKASLAITIFLTYGFFVTMTRDSLPHNSLQVSYYVVYICNLLILSVCTMLFVIMESRIYGTMGDKKCPINIRLPSILRKNNPVKPMDQTKTTKALGHRGKDQKKSVRTEENAGDTIKCWTWTIFLQQLDVIVFCIAFIFIFIVTLILLTIIM